MTKEIVTKLIDEINELTGNAVAKKQEAAKLNFPKLVEIIKSAAKLGNSECTVSISQMNEFDNKLLQDEGFRVSLVDKPRNYNDAIAQYNPNYPNKEWVIKW